MSEDLEDGDVELWDKNNVLIDILSDNVVRFTANEDMGNEILVVAKKEISNLTLNKGTTPPTQFHPAPEDLTHATQYTLSQPLQANPDYTISIDTDITDNWIGVWIGTDYFAGYFKDGKLTFNLDEEIDTDKIIIKSLNGEGVVNTTNLVEGSEPKEFVPDYRGIDFTGAIIKPQIGLELSENNFEYLPMGQFIVDEQSIQNDIINLKAIDNMIRLDSNYSENTNQSYPASLFQIYTEICSRNNINIGSVDFPNKNYVVAEIPEGDFTDRDILGYVAELAGGFVKVNRNGHLEIRWYKNSGVELNPEQRYNFKPSDEKINISGIIFETEEEKYIAGTQEYAIDISENPLIQDNIETILPSILDQISDLEFNSYKSETLGFPHLDSGDKIKMVSLEGKEYNTIITSIKYKFGGKTNISGEGKAKVKQGFKGTTSKRLNQIVRSIRENNKDYNDKFTDLEQAQLNASEIMASMLGGYYTKYNGTIYISNAEDFVNSSNTGSATEYWQQGLGGYAHYKKVDGTWIVDTAITADGSIVAMLVSAGIVTADMVKTGLLQSKDGSIWIDLDTGYFNLGVVSLNENGFQLNVPDTFYDNLIVNAHNRLYQSQTYIPLKSNNGEIQLQLLRDEINPYYKVTGTNIDLYGNFPKVQYAEDLVGQEVVVSLDVLTETGSTIVLEGREFNIDSNVWTRIYSKKVFPTTTTKQVRVINPYSRKITRDIIEGNNIINSLTTTENTLYYRNIQVQKGKILTDWSLTPEELENKFEQYTSEFKILKDQIISKVNRDEIGTEIIQNATSVVTAINSTDGVGKVKTTKVTVDEYGLTVDDGAIIIKDSQNKNIITSQGLKFKGVFPSSGMYQGWSYLGLKDSANGIEPIELSISSYVPLDLIITSAKLHIHLIPIYIEDDPYYGIPNGYYHARGLRLYKVTDMTDGVVYIHGLGMTEYPVFNGKTDITTSTLGQTWNVTGNKMVKREVDVTSDITNGENILVLKTNLAINNTNMRYASFALLNLEVEGFLRG